MENSFSLVNQRYFPPLGTATKLFKLLQQIGQPVQELGIPIWTKRLQHKVILRPLTSDVSAFSQIFIGDEFGRLEIKNPKVILDLGANMLYIHLFFKSIAGCKKSLQSRLIRPIFHYS